MAKEERKRGREGGRKKSPKRNTHTHLGVAGVDAGVEHHLAQLVVRLALDQVERVDPLLALFGRVGVHHVHALARVNAKRKLLLHGELVLVRHNGAAVLNVHRAQHLGAVILQTNRLQKTKHV
jgi:hypothetical protein